MQQFEYKTWNGFDPDLIKRLNEDGSAGWRVIHMAHSLHPTNPQLSSTYVIQERPIPQTLNG